MGWRLWPGNGTGVRVGPAMRTPVIRGRSVVRASTTGDRFSAVLMGA